MIESVHRLRNKIKQKQLSFFTLFFFMVFIKRSTAIAIICEQGDANLELLKIRILFFADDQNQGREISCLLQLHAFIKLSADLTYSFIYISSLQHRAYTGVRGLRTLLFR